MSKTIQWGILGTSFISEVMAEAIQASGNGQILGIASRSPDKSRAFAKKFSIHHVYHSCEDLLNDAKINAVYIGLPNHLHKEWVIRCAQAGKHILCEKPFALSVHDVSDAFAAVEKAHVHCVEALMYRFHPFTKELQRLIKEKTIGEVKLIHAFYSASIAHLANPAFGGAIRNLGCYPVSLVRLLLGKEPIAVQGTGHMDGGLNNVNQASLVMTFDQQEMAVVSTADDIEMYWQFDIFGTDGAMKVISNPWKPEQTNNQVQIHRNDEIEGIVIQADKPLYTYQIDELNARILASPFSTPLHAEAKRDSEANVAVLEAWLNAVYPISNKRHSAA